MNHKPAPTATELALFAGCGALALILTAARWVCLNQIVGLAWYDAWFVGFEDVIFAAGVALFVRLAFRYARTDRARYWTAFVAWIFLGALLFYGLAGMYVLAFLRVPITWRLMVISDWGRGIAGTTRSILTPRLIFELTLAPFVPALCGVAAAHWFRKPLLAVSKRFYSVAGAIFLVLYCFAGETRVVMSGIPPDLIRNAHSVLTASLFEMTRPPIKSEFPQSFLADFEPVRTEAAPGPWAGRARGMNVVIVMLESVGSARVSLDEAANPDRTPGLRAVAANSLIFDRFYAPLPYTTDAITSTFCSVFAPFQNGAIGKTLAELKIPGLADVVRKAGYRAGFLFDGNLTYDREAVFLRNHGFDLEELDHDQPADHRLGMLAEAWIRRDTSHPFLLAMLTGQTHHPYYANADQDGSGTQLERRYRSAIGVADTMVSDLARDLARLGIAQRTLIVVMGDHGEAFGEHGELTHNFGIWEEETHVPFLIANPALFRGRVHMPDPGEQVDIGPTLLHMMSIPVPPEWQGRDLFSNPRDGRVYLFSNATHFSLAVLDRGFAWVFDEHFQRPRIYNLGADPGEQHDLYGDPSLAPKLHEAEQRLAAWSTFQNPYLSRYLPGPIVEYAFTGETNRRSF